MNLEYGPEYEDFRAEVIDFCKEYEGSLLKIHQVKIFLDPNGRRYLLRKAS